MLPLGYHADDEIVRWWILLGAAGAVAAIALTILVARRLRDRPDDSFVPPYIAFALAALTAIAMAIGFYPIGVLISLLAPVAGVRAVLARGARGTRRPALAAFLSTLLALDLGASAFAACAVTDGCFH